MNNPDERHPLETHPLASVFCKAAFEAKEAQLDAIPTSKVASLAHERGIEIGEAAALAYLAKHAVDDFMFEAEIDTAELVYGGVS